MNVNYIIDQKIKNVSHIKCYTTKNDGSRISGRMGWGVNIFRKLHEIKEISVGTQEKARATAPSSTNTVIFF